jgi:NADPH:quinone reductase-like Zn-dependent oxidoreductase
MIGVVVRDSELVLDEQLPAVGEGPEEVLVEMEAACIAPLDLQVAAAVFPLRPETPYIAGADGVGRVVSPHHALAGRRVRVRGAGVGTTRDGCAAELVALPLDALHALREDVDAVTAATFFVPCSTAAAALHDVGGLRPGERVAIRGASGAVGQVAVQLAVAAGAAETIAIVRSEARASAVPPGATVVVAESPADLRSRLADAELDLVVDTVGGVGLGACVGAMRPRGRLVLVGYTGGVRFELDALELLMHDVNILPLNGIRHEPETVPRADDWLDAIIRGELTVPTSAYPLERVSDAVAAVSASPSPGRVALVIRSL